MSNYEILKNTKNSYESILELLQNTDVSFEDNEILKKSLDSLEKIYNLAYSNMLKEKENLKTDACCKNCQNDLLISDNINYSYQCTECDENYYDFETDVNKVWYKKDLEEDKKLNSSFYLELDYDYEDKTVYIGTECSSGAKYKCNNIGQLMSSIETYCYNYLDYGENYSIEIWETEWHRDAGEGFVFNETFDSYDEALNKARKLFEDNNFASIEILDNNGEAIYCRDSESEDFYNNGERISCVDKDTLDNYIQNWNEHKEQTFKNSRLYCKSDDLFIAIDDTTGNCWTEEFKTEKDAQNWLLGYELEKEGNEIEV